MHAASSERLQRLARGGSDPAVVHQQKTLSELKAALDDLWVQRRPVLMDAVLAERTGSSVTAIRDAEANLLALETRENTVRGKLAEGHADRLRIREASAPSDRRFWTGFSSSS